MTDLSQATCKEWNEIGAPEAIVILPYLPQELEVKYHLKLDTYDDDGLGEARGAFIKAGVHFYFLNAHPDGPEPSKNVAVYARCFEPDTEIALRNLLEILEVERNSLLWEGECLGPASWILSRLDDNGNEIEMQRFQNEHSANWIKENYEAKGHKQTYFVRNAT